MSLTEYPRKITTITFTHAQTHARTHAHTRTHPPYFLRLQELEDAIAERFEPDQWELLSRKTEADGEYRAFGFTSSLGEKKDVAE